MKNNIDSEKKSYNAISIAILIITIVVGTGIFFKNDELYQATNSTLISVTGWIMVSMLVLTMLYAFMEISSSTAKTGEIGSLSNWAKKFYNLKVAKIVGYFFVFLGLPVNLALMSIYSTNLIFDSLVSQDIFSSLSPESFIWIRTIMTTIIALIMVSILGLINSTSNRQSKIIQKIGLFFKIIPALLVVIIAVIAFSKVDFSNQISNYGGVFDIHSIKNQGLESKNFSQIMAMLFLTFPPIMFAFDGFIYSANLQSETKTKKSFATGLIIGILLIVILYIVVSIAIFSLGNPITGFSLESVINNVFDQVWIANLFNVMLILAIIASISGLYTAAVRQTASLSVDNLVKDEKLKWIKKNKHEIPKNAGISLMVLVLGWIFFLRILDIAYIMDQFYDNGILLSNINYTAISAKAGDSVVVLSFLFYGIIIFGGILNRKLKKVEVDKFKGFSIIAFIALSGVMFTFIFSSLSLIMSGFDELKDYLLILVIFIYLILMIIIYFYNEKKLKHLDPKFKIKKDIEIQKFYN